MEQNYNIEQNCRVRYVCLTHFNLCWRHISRLDYLNKRFFLALIICDRSAFICSILACPIFYLFISVFLLTPAWISMWSQLMSPNENKSYFESMGYISLRSYSLSYLCSRPTGELTRCMLADLYWEVAVESYITLVLVMDVVFY